MCCCIYSLEGFSEFLMRNNSLRYVFYLNIHNNVYINDERSAPAGGRDDDNSAQRTNKAGKFFFTISLTCVFTHILCIHLNDFFSSFSTSSPPPRVTRWTLNFKCLFEIHYIGCETQQLSLRLQVCEIRRKLCEFDKIVSFCNIC
jgi:hypothetical protein